MKDNKGNYSIISTPKRLEAFALNNTTDTIEYK